MIKYRKTTTIDSDSDDIPNEQLELLEQQLLHKDEREAIKEILKKWCKPVSNE